MKDINVITKVVKSNNFLKIENLTTMKKERRAKIISRSSKRIEEIMPLISSIISSIQRDGDKALMKYTEKYDGVKILSSKITVKKTEIKDAYKKVESEDKELIKNMQSSIDLIKAYHEQEKMQNVGNLKSWEKSVKAKDWKEKYQKLVVGQIYNPLNRIGVYVPGGNAILFTTALMGVTPAKVAGVKEIIVASPPSRGGDIDHKIIVAADLAGADLIVRAGGAQAIAALACGTKSVPKVDKIFGPGNIFVTAAKAFVASNGICAIDFIAGPSEIMIIADKTVDSNFVARDMVSQAQHDENASAILLTDSKKLANDVRKRIKDILLEENYENDLREITTKSLSNYGAIIIVDNILDAIYFSNDFAPEHLEIMTKNPRKWIDKIKNAGTICVGKYSPVAISDYICPNHILPTGGSARYTSGINIDMFLKKTSLLQANANMMPLLNKSIRNLSMAEGLYNQHGLSISVRLDYIKKKKKRKR
ncbi:MAG: histidinol dehydrogenase [Candidatus Hydrogenedentota bacterium]